MRGQATRFAASRTTAMHRSRFNALRLELRSDRGGLIISDDQIGASASDPLEVDGLPDSDPLAGDSKLVEGVFVPVPGAQGGACKFREVTHTELRRRHPQWPTAHH